MSQPRRPSRKVSARSRAAASMQLPASRPPLGVTSHLAAATMPADAAVAFACEAVRAVGETVTGTVWIHRAFPSVHLARARDVWVYLPPAYDPASERRYPVIYAQDGNNLFSAASAFAGQEWGLDETAEWLIGARLIPPVVIVGVANTDERLAEYTWRPSEQGEGGEGACYARFLREELKPVVDAVYATRPGREATGVLGSSLGGLLSLYLGAHEGDVFGLVGAMSPSLWWADGMACHDLVAVRRDLRVWLDMGGREGDDPEEWDANLADARRLASLFQGLGYATGIDFEYWEAPDDGHDEGAWGERAAQALRFLLAPL